MDNRLRILLRRYKLSRDSEDAVAFAEAILRLETEEPVAWVVDFFEGSDNGSDITLLHTQEDAYQYAAEFAEGWIKQYSPAMVEEFSKMVAEQRYTLAVKVFEDVLPSGYAINIYSMSFTEPESEEDNG